MKRLIVIIYLFLIIPIAVYAQQGRPLILPFQTPPGLDTWLLGQAYGNTTGAYNQAVRWYGTGQGLHFGIDYATACGTPLIAVADGTVMFVDNLNFGSAPHNLILRHDALGLVSLYGHLLQKPDLKVGQTIKQGDVVAYSGDPDGTCDSRPHLHYELRSLDYRTTYNPVNYTDANWNTLALIGSYSGRFFQMDLNNARRWMDLDNQPNVSFGGQRLNNYALTWPPAESAPSNPPFARILPALNSAQVTMNPLETTACCYEFWWHPIEANRLFTVDGLDNQRAQLFAWDAPSRTLLAAISPMPVPFNSPDFGYAISPINNMIQIQRMTDAKAWLMQTGGAIPAMNTDNTRLMWIERGGDFVPGQDAPTNSIYMSDIQGTDIQLLFTEQGISAVWLDANRLLLSLSQRPYTQLDIYDVTTQERYTLGRWYRPRGFNIAPGGTRLMFYLASQPNPDDNSIYVIETRPNAQTQKIDWFGAWRWRDANSVYYIPFEPNNPTQQLMYYNIETRQTVTLTDPISQPFAMMNGQWSVSADGSQIAFRNSLDRNLWLMTIEAN